MTYNLNKMKILLLHNFYQSSSPSGEDGVYRNEVELLRKNGVDVVIYERHNDEINKYELWEKFFLPFINIWSKKTYNEVRNLIKKEKPDVAHFHNIWYLISPSAYYACKDAGIPVVQTLHNFRLFCTNGLLMRNGKICEECITKIGDRSEVIGHGGKEGKIGDRSEVIGKEKKGYWSKLIKNAIKYGCYRNSRLLSLPVALTEYIHWLKRTWIDKVDAYIALTEFGKKKFIECGLPEEKIFVKPNFLPDPPEPRYSDSTYAVFLGRISAEKGVSVLINAFQYLLTISDQRSAISDQQIKLKIIGDGPLRENLQQIVDAGKIAGIEFTGRKSFTDAMDILVDSKFMIMPALCYEGFPMAIRESFACGKPVIASRLGAMAELVEDGKTGLLFEPGNPVDLAEKMKWMIEHEDACVEMGKNARKVFEEKYTAERNFQILMDIYKKVIAHS